MITMILMLNLATAQLPQAHQTARFQTCQRPNVCAQQVEVILAGITTCQYPRICSNNG